LTNLVKFVIVRAIQTRVWRNRMVDRKPKKKPPRRVSEPMGLYEAKTRLSELVDAAALGTEFTIAKSGKPMARLVPYGPEHARTLRKPGKGKGRVWMARDFDAPLAPDVLRLFTGDGA
jgi:prevent-host-death family protein